MGRPFFASDGKQLAVGERPRQAHAPLEVADVPAVDRPKRSAIAAVLRVG